MRVRCCREPLRSSRRTGAAMAPPFSRNGSVTGCGFATLDRCDSAEEIHGSRACGHSRSRGYHFCKLSGEPSNAVAGAFLFVSSEPFILLGDRKAEAHAAGKYRGRSVWPVSLR